MHKIYISKVNNPNLYLNTSHNINKNKSSNSKKSILYNFSTRIRKTKNYLGLKGDLKGNNSQLNNSNNENIKGIKLNQIKNKNIHLSNNHTHEYIPFSSRDKKIQKNNFIFFNNEQNKTIVKSNEQNNFKEKINFDKNSMNKINEYNTKINGLIYKSQIENNLSISKKMDHPFSSQLNIKNHLYDKNKLYYQTPKSILIQKKNYNNFNDEKNRKIKYRRIFSENIIKNRTLEKNGYNSYKNIYKNYYNNIKIKSNCITPFINSRYLQKFKKYNFGKKLDNIKRNNININTDIQNNSSQINKNSLSYKYQIENAPFIKISQHQYSNNLKSSKIFDFPSNLEEIISYDNKNKNIKKVKIINIESNDLINKETIPSRNIIIGNNFDYIDKNLINSNRYTNYEQRKLKNNLFLSHLENSKKLNNKQKIFTDITSTELFSENKENINSNLNVIQDSFLIKDSINNLNYEFELGENIKKNKYKNKIKNIPLTNKIKKNKIIRKKVNLSNTSDVFKENITINKYLKNDIFRNEINTEIEKDKLKNCQLITLSKKTPKIKGELYKNKNNKIEIKFNKEEKLKRNKFNTSPTIIKLNHNKKINSKELKINVQENINSMNKIIQKGNLKLNNTNFDTFLKNSLLLNDNQNIYSKQSQTTLSTSLNLFKFTSNSNKLKYLNIEENSNKKENKSIFALFYSKNNCNKIQNFQISAICFDPEEASFKIKKIENKNFIKYFYESINKNNNTNKNIYLMKNEDYFIVTGRNTNKFYKYNFTNNKLEQKSDLNYNHCNGGMIYYNDQIICLSGNLTKKVEVFSENNNIWLDLPEMNIERSFFSSCIIKDRYLFVFFGYNYQNKKYLDSIEYLDMLEYNLNLINNNSQKCDSNSWRYLKYNYFNSNPKDIKINLIGALAFNIIYKYLNF